MRIVPTARPAQACLALCLALLAVGCLPERRPDANAAPAQPGEDAGADVAEDVTGEDVAKGEDVAAASDVPLIVGCTDDKECKDLAKNPCHSVSCNFNTGFCEVEHKPDGANCGDDEPCRTDMNCTKGHCSWKQTVCNDGNPCTKDECLKSAGCSYEFLIDDFCDDANPCTKSDKCKESKCVGTPISFSDDCPDDENECTKSGCTPEKGCHFVYVELATGSTKLCDDGDSCTSPDNCAKGKCIAGGQKKCPDSDGNPCTIAGCHPALGCGEAPVPGMTCNDSNPCTKGDYCQIKKDGDPTDPASQVQCKGVQDACDDDNACTDDICDGKNNGVCKNTPAQPGVECDDGDVCTSGSACTSGKCGGGKPTVCDDGNACTKDDCVAAKGGCNHMAQDKAPCDDGSACTVGEICVAEACQSKDDGKCDDGNACTEDKCVAAGCQSDFAKVSTACGPGKCWWGQCLEPKCGNKVCQTGEDEKTCASDCPAGGGACAANDAPCIGTCIGERCKDADAACAGESDCLALQACVDKCSDAACGAGCLGQASVKALGLYQVRHACRLAACVKNNWWGKACAKGPTLGDCVAACGPGACWAHDVSCKANADCAGTDACINKCANDVACETKCLGGVSATGVALQTALATCRNKLCL